MLTGFCHRLFFVVTGFSKCLENDAGETLETTGYNMLHCEVTTSLPLQTLYGMRNHGIFSLVIGGSVQNYSLIHNQ